ncbi:alkaline-phosphatase-like protein [Crepidotus variabilis]|uniref:Alkaline-phosphatase-like protein n=1 Tax=Crepidotus variabilis TaxID=179855 RepID=A0A9P6EQY7_9AGAR|nr:alkaline-phosphatase-like protein [Crepidotus variabilis]
MASTSSKTLKLSKGPTSSLPNDVEQEERRGLLNDSSPDNQLNSDHFYGPEEKHGRRRTKRVAAIAAGLIALLVTGTFARTFLWAKPDPRIQSFSAGQLFNNGTHEFKRTVVIVSIDGLRADYLDRNLSPHLLALSKKGLRAKSMKPVFPTLTFPNHWALMTGLHAESHGIVANNFWDPTLKEEFHYNRISSAWNPVWWLGEPMWETAGKAGVITANLMWPGPPKTTSGASASYFVPWKDKVSLDWKLDQITKWVDLPFETRPQLIMMYEPSLDQAGHATGPYSKRVNETLVQVDTFAKDLQETLAARNLTDIIDVVFVSDHGMTDTSHPEHIYMEDILGEDGIGAVAHEDGWPAMGFRFHENANISKYLSRLVEASDASPDKFSVYTHETMPERYHFSNNERIAPIYVVPEIGYVLTTRAEGDVGLNKGSHGYDNNESSMHAMFVAHGPFSHAAKAQHKQLSSRATKGWHSTSEDVYVMETFRNVEIYNLVMKLLGITKFSAPNNGTVGFWDQYISP